MNGYKLLALLCFGLLGSCVMSQESSDIVLRTRGELVLIPAVVTEHRKPVSGLAAKDFTVLLDGKPQDIPVFEAVHARPAQVQTAAPRPNIVSNYADGDSQQDVVIVLLDVLNAGFTARNETRDYLGKMANQFSEAHTPVTLLLLSSSGLRQVHSFTSHPENLQKAIDQWKSGSLPYSKEQMKILELGASNPVAPMDDGQGALALFQSVDRRYLDAVARDIAVTKETALEQIAEAFVGIPGRKKLIWISNGFPVIAVKRNGIEGRSIGDYAAQDAAINDSLSRAWSALSSANIAVYPVDSNLGRGGSWDGHFSPEHGGHRFDSAESLEIGTNTPSLLEAAQSTGGFSCTLPPKACVENVLADAQDYYLLGFYLHGRAAPGWHRLEVKVDRPSLKVRARTGFEIASPEAGKAAKHNQATRDPTPAEANTPNEHPGEVMSALQSPLDYTDIPLALRCRADRLDSGEMKLELVVHSPSTGIAIDPEMSVNVDYLAFVRRVDEATGHTFPTSLARKLTEDQQKTIVSTGFLFRNQVTVSPGRYAIRMFVRDNIAHKIGTVSTMVDLVR